jgi:hypothetical protein
MVPSHRSINLVYPADVFSAIFQRFFWVHNYRGSRAPLLDTKQIKNRVFIFLKILEKLFKQTSEGLCVLSAIPWKNFVRTKSVFTYDLCGWTVQGALAKLECF